MSTLSLLFLARLGILVKGGGAYTIYNEIFISHHLYSQSMPRLITDGTLLISPPFTFGLNLLFVFGGEDINTEG